MSASCVPTMREPAQAKSGRKVSLDQTKVKLRGIGSEKRIDTPGGIDASLATCCNMG